MENTFYGWQRKNIRFFLRFQNTKNSLGDRHPFWPVLCRTEEKRNVTSALLQQRTYVCPSFFPVLCSKFAEIKTKRKHRSLCKCSLTVFLCHSSNIYIWFVSFCCFFFFFFFFLFFGFDNNT